MNLWMELSLFVILVLVLAGIVVRLSRKRDNTHLRNLYQVIRSGGSMVIAMRGASSSANDTVCVTVYASGLDEEYWIAPKKVPGAKQFALVYHDGTLVTFIRPGRKTKHEFTYHQFTYHDYLMADEILRRLRQTAVADAV